MAALDSERAVSYVRFYSPMNQTRYLRAGVIPSPADPPPVPRRRQPLRVRAAMLMVVLAQLLVGGLTPLIHARPQSTIGTHIESHSSRRHYVHDEGRCAVCAARVNVAPVPTAEQRELRPEATTLLAAGRGPAEPRVVLRRGPSAPRAPPVGHRPA